MRALLVLVAICGAAKAEPSNSCRLASWHVASVLVTEREVPKDLAPLLNAAVAASLALMCDLEKWDPKILKCLVRAESSTTFDTCAPGRELAKSLQRDGKQFSVSYEVRPQARLGALLRFETQLALGLGKHGADDSDFRVRIEVVASDAARATSHADRFRTLALTIGIGPGQIWTQGRAAATAKPRVVLTLTP